MIMFFHLIANTAKNTSMRMFAIFDGFGKLTFVIFVALVISLFFAFSLLKDRDGLVTVVGTTEHIGGELRGRPQTHNAWMVSGAILCAEIGTERADAAQAIVTAIPGSRVIDGENTTFERLDACGNDRFLRLQLATGNVFLHANSGVHITFDRVSVGPFIVTLRDHSEDGQGLGSIGYEGERRVALKSYAILIFDKFDERAQQGESLIFPLRLGEAVMGRIVSSAAPYLLLSGNASIRERSSDSTVRYLAASAEFDPGDEVRLLFAEQQQNFAEGFVRLGADPAQPGIEFVLYQSNATLQISRRGAADFVLAPSWTARLAHDPYLGAFLAALGTFAGLLTILWYIYDATQQAVSNRIGVAKDRDDERNSDGAA